MCRGLVFWRLRRRALLDDDDRVERALVVLDRVLVLGIGAPGAVDHELVLVLAGGELDGGGVETALGLVGHLLGSGAPLVERAGEVDRLALFGVDGERHRLLGGLCCLLGDRLCGGLLGDDRLFSALLCCLDLLKLFKSFDWICKGERRLLFGVLFI